MQRIRLGAAALNQTPLDWEGNISRIASACEEARRRQISILCCPELCISGYGCEDAFHSSGVLSTAMDMLLELEPVSRGLFWRLVCQCGGLVVCTTGLLYSLTVNFLEFLRSST